jgi:hypothetical protein
VTDNNDARWKPEIRLIEFTWLDLKSILILCSHIRLGLSICVLPTNNLNIICSALAAFLMRAVLPRELTIFVILQITCVRLQLEPFSRASSYVLWFSSAFVTFLQFCYVLHSCQFLSFRSKCLQRPFKIPSNVRSGWKRKRFEALKTRQKNAYL